MKITFTLIALLFVSHIAFSQANKQSIDYQYFRDAKDYYAFELFKDQNTITTTFVKLNFTTNAVFNKIEKIYLKSGEKEIKIQFKKRDDEVKSDNEKQKTYPIIFDWKDLLDKNISCESQFIFKLDNGFTYTLPINICMVTAQINKN